MFQIRPAALVFILLTAGSAGAQQTAPPSQPSVAWPQPSPARSRAWAIQHLRQVHRLPDDAVEAIRRFSQDATRGSQPVNAEFLGNLTTIAVPSGGALLLARETNCSLTEFDVTYMLSNTSPIGYSAPAPVRNFEQTLHAESLLTTAPDQFPGGCKDPTTGVASRPVIYLGQTTSNPPLRVGASALYNGTQQQNQVVTLVTDLADGYKNQAVQAVGLNPESVVGGDLNGDGNTDLVSIGETNTPSASIAVQLANSEGSFQSAVNYAIPGIKGESAVIDDVNGDGKLDVIVSSETNLSGQPSVSQISVLLGNGDGTLKTAVSFTIPASPNSGVSGSNLTTGDFNDDGKKDIIDGEGQVFLGKGDGTFTAVAQAAFPGTLLHLAAADFNKDGKLDIATDDGVTIRVYYGNGDGSFTPGPGYATVNNQGFLTATDLDGDGNPDIFSGWANGGIFGGDGLDPNLAYALMGKGDGTFQGAFSGDFNYNGGDLADLNGDKKLDVIGLNNALGSPTISFTSYLGNGDGTFKTGPTLTVSPYTSNGNPATLSGMDSYALGDFNHDGIPDLVYIGQGGAAGYFVAYGKGDGSFATPTFIPAPSFVGANDFDEGEALTGISVADFNHDGVPDLIYTYEDTSSNTGTFYAGFAVQLGTGTGTFSPPAASQTYSGAQAPAEPPPTIAAIADVNKDGNPDLLVVATTGTNQTYVLPVTLLNLYLGKGDGTFAPAASLTVADNPNAAVVADMNNDGKPDLITIGARSSDFAGELAVSLGNGDGTFQAPATLLYLNTSASGTFGDALAVADFDSDGKPDVFLAGYQPGVDDGVFLGTGSGTLQSTPAGTGFAAPLEQLGMIAIGQATTADFNGDGKPDVLSGSTILLNEYGVNLSVPPPTQPDFAFTTGSSSLSLAPGKSGTVSMSVTPASGFSQTLTFACSGLPGGSACGFSPASVTPSGSAAIPITVTITTTAPSSGKNNSAWPFAGGGATLAMGCLFFFGRRRRLPAILCFVLLLSLGGITIGCGGGGNATSSNNGSGSGSGNGSGNLGTPAGTSTVTITATGSGASPVSHTATVLLTVQ